ncbi:MAG: AAA family ATPase [Gammaproteobacteria bacterium]|nr:AAA family ATPase [Gammaproteobacteria bacterium]
MLHALRRAEGFVMITGQPGTGKTTLVSDLVRTLSFDQVDIAKIVSTQLTSNDLLNLVAYSFNLDPEGWSKAKVLVQVERFLKQQYQQGRRPLLIVDEAQGMDEDALEELRLLTNLLVGNHQLLQVFLVGQEQLRDTVNTPSLEQLQQRLIASTYLEPLDVDDTRAYIKHRLHCVNWRGDPLISTETYAMIQHYSHGIPRRINQICSRLFLHGSIEGKHRLGTADLEIVVEELQQELLLPMGKQGIYEVAPWPEEQYEETYEEEPQTSPSAPKIVLPTTATPPGTERATQPSSLQAAATRHHMPASEPAAVAGHVAGTDNNHASIHHKKRVILLALVAILLAVYISDGDMDQPVPDQHSMALSQAGPPQLVLPATEDSEVTSVQPRPETPSAEEQATSGTGSSASEASSNTRGDREIFALLAIETGQNPAPELDPGETSLPAPPLAMVDPDKTPAPATTDHETAAQNEPGQDIPTPAQEVAPVVALSQDNQAREAPTPGPVKELTMTPPLSEEEQIAELLANGQRSLKQYRLLTPKDDSAYHYFQQVLKLDPGNSDALYGIEQVVAGYTLLATDALNKNDKQKAELYITRGFRISPNDEGLQALRDWMNVLPIKSAPEPEPEDFFTRFKKFFSQPPNEKIDDRIQTDEP